MSEIKSGKVVCLKSEKNASNPQKFTVGAEYSGHIFKVH